MEATVFAGWIYDHLLPETEAMKVAHPHLLRAIAAAKKKNDRIDASKIADCLQSRVYSVHSMRPSSRRATAKPFRRG